MVKLEKVEDKLINGDSSGTSPKISRREYARVTRKSDWRFGQKRGKKRIHKVPAHMETLYIFLCPKERKLRVPNEAQFSDRFGRAGYPMTFRGSATLPIYYIDKYLF
jgi:hypothetical protein